MTVVTSWLQSVMNVWNDTAHWASQVAGGAPPEHVASGSVKPQHASLIAWSFG